MSGPKHTPGPLEDIVASALTEYAEGGFAKYSDAQRAIRDLAADAYRLGQQAAAPRLAEALKRCDSEAVWDDLVDMWLVPNEVMDEIRAALREAGCES